MTRWQSSAGGAAARRNLDLLPSGHHQDAGNKQRDGGSPLSSLHALPPPSPSSALPIPITACNRSSSSLSLSLSFSRPAPARTPLATPTPKLGMRGAGPARR